jgi:hypothetical protein
LDIVRVTVQKNKGIETYCDKLVIALRRLATFCKNYEGKFVRRLQSNAPLDGKDNPENISASASRMYYRTPPKLT